MKKKIWIIVDGDTGTYGFELFFGSPDVCMTREEADSLLKERWNDLIQYDDNWQDNDANELNLEYGYFAYTDGNIRVSEQIYEKEIEI
jgi:hypothetical protein